MMCCRLCCQGLAAQTAPLSEACMPHCRYEVDTQEWPKTTFPPLKSTKGLGDKIGQWHDLLLPLYLIDPEHRIVGDQALDANANDHH